MSAISSLPNIALPKPLPFAPGDRKQPQRMPWEDKVTLSDQARGLAPEANPLSQRVARIGQHTAAEAQRVMTDIAKQLFGDKGDFEISFDSAEVSAESSFAAAWQKTEGADGASEMAGMRLDESGHFLGRGHITTADGRTFEFEIEVNIERSIQATAAQSSTAHQESPAEPAKPAAGDLKAMFAGTAAELLQRLTDHPVGTPFQLDIKGDDGPIQRAGKMFMRLLDLPGTPYLDWSKDTAKPNADGKPCLDVHA